MQTDSSISSFQLSLYKEDKSEGDNVLLQPVIAVDVTGGAYKAASMLQTGEEDRDIYSKVHCTSNSHSRATAKLRHNRVCKQRNLLL